RPPNASKGLIVLVCDIYFHLLSVQKSNPDHPDRETLISAPTYVQPGERRNGQNFLQFGAIFYNSGKIQRDGNVDRTHLSIFPDFGANMGHISASFRPSEPTWTAS